MRAPAMLSLYRSAPRLVLPSRLSPHRSAMSRSPPAAPPPPRLPRTVLGTMEFGRRMDAGQSAEAVREFLRRGHEELDTAHMYADGETERVLGGLGLGAGVKLATKANPWEGKTLRAESVRQQLETSLQRLRTPSVHLFYLHAPDHHNPTEETLAACQQLYLEGKFKELGLSNYAAWEVMEVYCICKKNNWVLPTVYQGMYNATTPAGRDGVAPLLAPAGNPILRLQPAGRGLLTGKYQYEDKDGEHEATRFFGNSWAETYRNRYWKKHHFEAISCVRRSLEEMYSADVRPSLTASALRWMYHHSKLEGSRGDAVILGMSSTAQLLDNLTGAEGGPLLPPVVTAYNNAWDMVAHDCPNYFR